MIASIRFLYTNVLNKEASQALNIKLRKETKLTVVLSEEEIVRIFKDTHNLKHKTILSQIYSLGLRLGECLDLKPEDIDFDQKRIHNGSKQLRFTRIFQVIQLIKLKVH